MTAVLPVPAEPMNITGLNLKTCISNRLLSLVVCSVGT